MRLFSRVVLFVVVGSSANFALAKDFAEWKCEYLMAEAKEFPTAHDYAAKKIFDRARNRLGLEPLKISDRSAESFSGFGLSLSDQLTRPSRQREWSWLAGKYPGSDSLAFSVQFQVVDPDLFVDLSKLQLPPSREMRELIYAAMVRLRGKALRLQFKLDHSEHLWHLWDETGRVGSEPLCPAAGVAEEVMKEMGFLRTYIHRNGQESWAVFQNEDWVKRYHGARPDRTDPR